MSTKKRRAKSIVYKQAQFKSKHLTLQQLLEKARNQKPKAVDRIELLDEEAVLRRFINSFVAQDGMIFGQMLFYEAGKDQTVVVLDDSIPEYPVESLPIPKRQDGKGQEVLESVLYFGVLDNHVVLAQSQALRARDFENHLYWLFRRCTQVLEDDQVLVLSDQPSPKARDKIEQSPVKRVVLGASLESQQEEVEETTEVDHAKKIKFRPVGKAFDVISAVLGDDWRKDVKLDEALDDANLQVNLEITYIRKTTVTAHKLLDNIATSMRHAEPEDVKVLTDSGAVIKGDEIKLGAKLHVNTFNGIVDSTDMYREMHQWLEDRIKDGSVQ